MPWHRQRTDSSKMERRRKVMEGIFRGIDEHESWTEDEAGYKGNKNEEGKGTT